MLMGEKQEDMGLVRATALLTRREKKNARHGLLAGGTIGQGMLWRGVLPAILPNKIF